MAEPSPRGKKKKSHLAKLAARKRESDDSSSELGSRTSLRDSYSNHSDALRRQSIDRYHKNNSNRYDVDSDDSDEGIAVHSSNSKERQRLPSDGTVNRFNTMKVNGHVIEDESDSDERKGEKRVRDLNSDGDDLRKDGRKKHDADTHESYRLTNTLQSDDDMTSESEDKNDEDQLEMQSQYKKLLDTSDTASPKLVRRKSPLTMRKSELDTVEEAEVSDDMGSGLYPRPSAKSPSPPVHKKVTSMSLNTYYPTYERPDSAVMSDRSLGSTSSALRMISTREARNRSYLVGSMTSAGALLGTEELERFFPDRKMRIYVGTWNMCEMKNVPSSLDDFLLPDEMDMVCDMIVIGTQESTGQRREWEIKLQETLGPQHVLLHSVASGVLYLNIFIRRDLIWFCSVPETDFVPTRAFSSFKTKGGIGVSITIFGTSLLFINSHLSPHDGNMKQRIEDYNKINSQLNLPQVVNSNTYANDNDVTSRFDCVFWCGDTNFRILKERDRVEHKMKGIEQSDFIDYEDLVQHDELFQVRNQGLAFQEFQEGRIKFRPSYKYDIGTDHIDTSKKMRIPSYTDRVLFRCKRKHSIQCVHYDSAFSVCESDHKPVYGVYEVTLRPGRDNIPLGAGQFNREVWLEANRRRAQGSEFSKKPSEKDSKVCVIQ